MQIYIKPTCFVHIYSVSFMILQANSGWANLATSQANLYETHNSSIASRRITQSFELRLTSMFSVLQLPSTTLTLFLTPPANTSLNLPGVVGFLCMLNLKLVDKPRNRYARIEAWTGTSHCFSSEQPLAVCNFLFASYHKTILCLRLPQLPLGSSGSIRFHCMHWIATSV